VFRAVGSGGGGFLRELLDAQEDDDADGDAAPPPRPAPPRASNRAPGPHAKPDHAPPPVLPAAPPKRRVSALLTADDEAFVRGGGRIVLAIGDTYGPLQIRTAHDASMHKVFPLWPGLDTISMPAPRTLLGPETLRRAHTIYTAGDAGPAVARLVIGSGDVILTAQPELFTNASIGSAKSLGFLAALADTRQVWFDETAHGLARDAGLLDLLKEWRLGPFLLLLLVAGAALFWRDARRIGSAEEEDRDTRSEAVDLVRALGALYDRSLSNRHALALYRDALARSVAAATGLRGEPLQQRVAEMTGGLAIDGDAFDAQLAVLNDAFRSLERG
jgi:hypothetical protein